MDVHLNSYNTPFKSNGKELDDEIEVRDSPTLKTIKIGRQTGNYYYGARYYDPKTSIWLSVDPLAEQMPSWSSYNYTFSNPIKYTDSTGMAPEIAESPDDWIRNNKTGKIEWFMNDESGAYDKWGADADITTLSKDYFDKKIIGQKISNEIDNKIEGMKWNMKVKWEQAKQDFSDVVPDGQEFYVSGDLSSDKTKLNGTLVHSYFDDSYSDTPWVRGTSVGGGLDIGKRSSSFQAGVNYMYSTRPESSMINQDLLVMKQLTHLL